MTHRDLCLRAMVIFGKFNYDPGDELIGQWLEDLMRVDEATYQKNPADAFVRRFTETT